MKETIKLLRRRVKRSEFLNDSVAWLIYRYIRFAYETSEWERHGFANLNKLAKSNESVIVALWHQRLLMTPYFFPLDLGEAGTVTSAAPAGSLASRVHLKFGLRNVRVGEECSGFATSRAVAKLLREGVTMGFAADGPKGPERVASLPLINWARMCERRVFIMSYSVRDAYMANSWDRMMIPRPYTKGVFVCREWAEQVPRNVCSDELETLRVKLGEALNATSAEADRLVGRDYSPALPES